MVLMLVAMTVSATAQMKAYSPPEQDIGHIEQMVATLSVDGQTVVSFDQQFYLVDWQTPFVLNMESTVSAQVIDAYTVGTPCGEVGMMLVCYKWPDTGNAENENYNYNQNGVPHSRCNDSFTTAHTDYTYC